MALWGLSLFVLLVYGSIYLLFFDSAKDKALNASLLTVMRLANKTISETPERGKQLDTIYQVIAEGIEARTGIDITESIEDALENNEKIEDIECTEEKVAKDMSVISINFRHKEAGRGRLLAYVRPPSFSDVERGELLAFDTDVQFANGKTCPINLFLGVIYGFDEKGMEIFVSSLPMQLLKNN